MKELFTVLVFSVICVNASAQNLFRTACQGNLARLDSLLSDSSIAVKDNRGRSLLHWAVACKQKEVFDYLVRKGIRVNGEDHQKRTPMHVAVQFGNEEFFDRLVNLQPNSQWVQQYGTSLLEQTVLREDISLMKKLVHTGVDINGTNSRGSTALEIAQRMDAQEVADYLLSQGADKSLVRTFKMEGKYMGQEATGTMPHMFAPNFISTEEQEFGSVFNASGTEFYYGVDVYGKNEIRYSRMIGKQWSKPTVLLSHDRYGYNDPFLSPAGDRLYFISNRALDGVGEPKDIDIWYVNRLENGWSEPVNAGPNINTDRDEYYISFTQEGTMYFSSDGHAPQERNRTDHDIYFSKFVNDEFQRPVRLGEGVNSEAYEADVYVSPDESYLIFCSTRENGFGQGDLYISIKGPDGAWTTAVNMGKAINTDQYEYCPFVTQDGKYLFYTSNQDIYWVSTEIIQEIKERNK